MQSVANLFVKNRKFGDGRKSMELEKIKCVILDFDNTMYSYGDWTRGDALTEEFLKEQKILPGVENKLEELKKIYPDLHLYQRVFAYFRDNGLDDGVYRKFNNERIPDIRTKDTVFIKPEIIEKISKKYKLFMISDSFLSYLLYYLELNKIDKDWFDGIYQNNYEDDDYTKIPMMKKVLTNTGFKPDEIVMVGDNELTDIVSAKSLGYQTYHVKDVFDTENFLNELIKFK